MALLDIFKKKPAPSKSPAAIQAGKEKPAKKAKPAAKSRVAKAEKTEGAAFEAVSAPKKTKKEGYAWKALKTPHVTEKATDLTERNQYIFKVFPQSNKVEIKNVIENFYGVSVESVRIINVPSKKRRLGKRSGWKKGYKKAIVKIKQGQKIEVMPR